MFALSSNLLSHPRNILTNVALFYCLLLQELSFLSFFYFFFLLFSSPDESLVTQRKKNKMKLNETRILRYINSRWLARNSPKISMFDILCSSIFFFFFRIGCYFAFDCSEKLTRNLTWKKERKKIYHRSFENWAKCIYLDWKRKKIPRRQWIQKLINIIILVRFSNTKWNWKSWEIEATTINFFLVETGHGSILLAAI